MNKCKCGKEPKVERYFGTQYPISYKVYCDCGYETGECFSEQEAKEKWDQITKDYDSAVESALYEKIKSKVESHYNLDDMLGNYKITEKGEMAIQFSGVEAELIQTKEDLDYHIKATEYWWEQWRKVVHEKEKLEMKLDKVREVVE